MYKMLNNNVKFEMLQFDHYKEPNYVLNLEKKIINVPKDLNNKEEITKVDYNQLYPCGSCRGILYGMDEVHKPVTDQYPSFRPILSAVNTPPYKLAKCLVPLLTPLPSTIVNNLTKESFWSLLELTTLDSFFIFDEKYCKQKDGVAMVFQLVPTLANEFLCHFEQQWMSDCPIDYKPFTYIRYVDDTFLLFSS